MAKIRSSGRKAGERPQAQDGRAPGEPRAELGSVTAGLNRDIVSEHRAECPQHYK